MSYPPPVTYACDWPGCIPQRIAVAYVDQGATHRPVCAEHADVASQNGSRVVGVESIDHLRVPHKVPTQAERERRPPPPPPELRPLDEVERIFRPTKSEPEPPEAPEPPSTPSRPPLRDAFANLAAALLETAKEEVERWRRK